VELNATMDREWNLIITHSPSSAAALVGFFALASSVFWASECHVVNKECAAAAPLPLHAILLFPYTARPPGQNDETDFNWENSFRPFALDKRINNIFLRAATRAAVHIG
jgi:hypothetical protein